MHKICAQMDLGKVRHVRFRMGNLIFVHQRDWEPKEKHLETVAMEYGIA